MMEYGSGLVSAGRRRQGGALGVFLLSCGAVASAGVVAVPLLLKLKATQTIRRHGPQAHQRKAGTPSFGGLFLLLPSLLVAGLATSWRQPVGAISVAVLCVMALGLADDWMKLLQRSSRGAGSGQFHTDDSQFVGRELVAQRLDHASCGRHQEEEEKAPNSIGTDAGAGVPGSWKLVVQVLIASAFCSWQAATLPCVFRLPLGGPALQLGAMHGPFCAFVVAAESNGVNLTDGLDGLAAGVCALAFGGMAFAVFSSHPHVGLLCAALAGGCTGFLFHNRHPAAAFMGDTGSLALGSALALVAIATGCFWQLLLCTLVVAVEAASVLLQVVWKRLTRFRCGAAQKLLRMAPLHHHFELGGHHEAHIMVAFTALAALSCSAVVLVSCWA